MYAQVAIKPNPLLRNGAYGIVMRGVQKCTRGCSSLRGRNKLPLCCIKLDTATDGEYGSGTMLLAAGKYLEKAELFGYEQDKRLRMSANILSILARKPIVTLDDNFLENGKTERFDFVLTNPLFQNDVVPEEVRREVLPQELWRVRGKHNLIVVRSLEALVENGWAAIVVPDSFLFSNKAETAFVRRWILNTYCVEGILSLPPKMFYRNTATRASVLLISNPFMKVEWMNGKTPYLFFYQWGDEVEPDQAGAELREIWTKRNDYFKQWTSQIGRNSFGNVPVPGDWEFPNFWFADITTVENENWNLLPRHYQPMERQELRFEDPKELLQRMILEQEELIRDMYALGAEVDRL